jgi:hypothetical protein
MREEENVQVEMTEDEAKAFILFQKHYFNIKKLIDSEVFSLANGRAILDFNSVGDIANIQKVLNYHFVIIKNP